MRDFLWYETYLDLDNFSEEKVSTAGLGDITLPSLTLIHVASSPHEEEVTITTSSSDLEAPSLETFKLPPDSPDDISSISGKHNHINNYL